jgi:hypothetical protein
MSRVLWTHREPGMDGLLLVQTIQIKVALLAPDAPDAVDSLRGRDGGNPSGTLLTRDWIMRPTKRVGRANSVHLA